MILSDINLLTDKQIVHAKKEINLSPNMDWGGSHLSAIKIAFIWLDAQKKTKSCNTFVYKTHIRAYGGFTVNYGDIAIAGVLHPDIKFTQKYDKYPRFNVSKKITIPSFNLLEGIEGANTRLQYRDHASRSFNKAMIKQKLNYPSEEI